MNQINNMHDDDIKNLLTQTADQINPDPAFTSDLERQLKRAHKPVKRNTLPSTGSFFRGLGWAALVIALAFGLNWIIRDLIPQATPGNGNFACPVTVPNGNIPPGESADTSNYLGNGQIWTVLWPDGKVYMSLEDQNADGSFSMKWGWWRGVIGPLAIEGHRLDVDAEPLRADIPEGYGDTGFQVSGLIFPTTGCWEVTGSVGDASLTFVTEVLYNGNLPIPVPQTSNTPVATFDYEVRAGDTCGFLANKFGTTVQEIVTMNGLTSSCEIAVNQVLKIPLKNGAIPTPAGDAYEWNGQTLYLNTTLPETPAEMKIYLARDDVPATEESVRALAEQFGMQGEIYQTAGELPDTTNYLVVDGNERLHVRSDRYFHYSIYTESASSIFATRYPNAETVIRDFMQSHGFDLAYEIEYSEMFGGYLVLPTSPDGFTVRHQYFKGNGFVFRFNKDGIESVDSSFMRYYEAATVGILSAEEAFQRMINPDLSYDAGTLMGMHSVSPAVSSWNRVRPLDESLTYFGFLSSTGRSVTGAAPLITLDSVTVTGNTNGIGESMPNTFVEAVGQFHETDGVKTFELESWKVYDGYEEGYQGTIQIENGQGVLNTPEGDRSILPDLPADLPLPAENVYVVGVTLGDVFEWKSLDTRMEGGGGGGGGGGGLTFYKLNLTGTPVPLNTPQPNPTIEPPFDSSSVEGLSGTLMVTIINQSDGSQRTEFGLISKDKNGNQIFLKLQGGVLNDLLPYNNRPILVWGTLDDLADGANLQLDRFEVLFPDIQFQILKGTQKWSEIQGQEVVIFTTESGESYVQLMSSGDIDYSLIGTEGDPVAIEVLKLPDEQFGGLPAIRVFSLGMAENGIPELTISADQPNVFDEGQASAFTPSTLTVENIELVYFTPDQRYPGTNSTGEPPYVQPVWRFSGHYSTGDEFEVLIQALKDEFLLPEYAPIEGPG